MSHGHASQKNKCLGEEQVPQTSLPALPIFLINVI